jgi:plastocyanin
MFDGTRRHGRGFIIAGLLVGLLVLAACAPAAPGDMETEPPAEEVTEEPMEEPTEPPTEEPTEEPTDEPTEPPAEEPTEEPMEEPTEPPAEEPTAQPTEEPTAEEVEVTMISTTFRPEEITVAPGTTVTWINEDSFAHTVTSGTRDNPTDMFDETVDGGGSFSFTFEEPGTYDTFCEFHPGMSGVVVVEE